MFPRRKLSGLPKICYRSTIDSIFFGHVKVLIAQGVSFRDAFRNFRDAYQIDFEDYTDNKCYYVFSRMTDEYRELCKNFEVD